MKTEMSSLWSLLTENIKNPGKFRKVQIRFDPGKCTGTYQCYAVCPVGCWTPDPVHRKVIFHDPSKCIACGAYVLQCPQDAIELK